MKREYVLIFPGGLERTVLAADGYEAWRQTQGYERVERDGTRWWVVERFERHPEQVTVKATGEVLPVMRKDL